MNGEEVDPELGRVGNRTLDGIADVQQLHVEEHVLVLALEIARQIEPTREQELEPDLVERNRIAKLDDKPARSSTVGMSRATIK